MKKVKLFPLTLFVVIFSGTFAVAQADFKFERTEYDFGTVIEKDDTLWVDFKFKNIGVEPLIISEVKTACECTLADYSKKPVMPGQMGVIKAGYKYKGKPGNFNKALTIMANTVPAVTVINIKGVVLEQKK